MIERFLTVDIKQQIQPLHWHMDILELYFVLRGSGRIIISNRAIEAEKGDLILFNLEDVHGIEDCSDDFLFVQLQIKVKACDRYINGISEVCFDFRTGSTDVMAQNLKAEIKDAIARIVASLSERDSRSAKNREQQALYACLEILNNLKVGFGYTETEYREFRSAEQYDRIWKAFNYIYDHAQQKLRLGDVARQVHVNETYLSRILKQELGMSFEELLSAFRAERGIRHLLESDMTITEIAYACGFSAPRYFNAAFEKNFGCTPMQYRKKNRDFFQMERDGEKAIGIAEEDAATLQDAYALLEDYRLGIAYYRGEKLIKDVCLALDGDGMPGGLPLAEQITTIFCEKEELSSFGAMQELMTLQQTLALREIILQDAGEDELRQINRRLRGMHVSIGSLSDPHTSAAHESATRLTLADFFYANGMPRPRMFLQEWMRQFPGQLYQVNEHALAGFQDGEARLLLFNFEEAQLECNLTYAGMGSSGHHLKTLLRSRHITPQQEERFAGWQPQDAREQEALRAFVEPERTVDLYLPEEITEEQIQLMPGQVCSISFQKVQF